MTGLGPGKRVLVVDDEPDLVTALAMLLDDEGYSVVTATSGPEAVALARDQHFDVVVTDLKLPGMDGFQILEAIGAVDPKTRPVVMTGFVSDETRSLLASRGTPFLLKPFELEEMLEALEGAGERLTEADGPG